MRLTRTARLFRLVRLVRPLPSLNDRVGPASVFERSSTTPRLELG